MTQAAAADPVRTCGILVVDDNEDVRSVLQCVLSQAGFSVWLASSGREALEVYRNRNITIDMVLLDVCMPDLDGPQTLAAMQQVTPRVVCCFMSGNPGSHTRRGLRDLGAAAVFAKPFRIPELIDALWEIAAAGRCTVDDPLAALFACRRLGGGPSLSVGLGE